MSRRGDSGSSAIELVLVTPVLIALIFTVVQAALVWHARHIALAAAQQGDRLARAASMASDASVREATLSYLRGLGADLAGDPSVTVTRSPGWVTVRVTAQAVSVVPGASLTVHAISRGPVESFRAATAGPTP